MIIILIAFLFTGCGNDTNPYKLEKIAEFPLAFPDPSGLALDPDGGYLWSVSDNPGGSIYRITLTGEIAEEIPVSGEDMEGIVIHPHDKTIWVVEERSRELVNVSRNGTVLNRIKLDIEQQNLNDGLEGITINPNNGHFFVVNEKNPRLLIELNPDFEIINSVPINFTGIYTITDLSGITYNMKDNTLWILSDESAKIVITDLEGNPIHMYRTHINDGEGIAIDPFENKVYVVSDDDQMLYVFLYE